MAGGTSPNALVLAPLDEDGNVWLTPHGGADVRAEIVGWVADQDASLDLATIDGGVMPVPAADASAPVIAGRMTPDTGERGILLYVVSSSADGEVGAPAAEFGRGLETATSPGGRGSAVVAVDGPIVVAGDDAVATLVGMLPASGAQDDNPTLEITSPSSGAQVSLAESSGQFEVAGRILGAGGIRSVHVMVSGRYIGAASVRADRDGYSWTLATSAPGGDHRLSVRAMTASGTQLTAEVAFRVLAPSDDVGVASPDVVIVEDTGAVLEVTDTSMVFDGPVAIRAGQIIAAASTPETPEGVLRRVISVEKAGAVTAVATRPASLTEAVLQVQLTAEDLPMTDPATAVDAGGIGRLGASRRAATLDQRLPALEFSGSFTFTYAEAGETGAERTDFEVDAALDVSASVEGFGSGSATGAITVPNEIDDSVPLPGDPDTTETSDKSALAVGGSVTGRYKIEATARLIIEISARWEWLTPPVSLDVFEAAVSTTQTTATEISAFGKISRTIAASGQKNLLDSSGRPINKLSLFLGRIVGVLPIPAAPIPYTLSLWLEPEFSATFAIEGKYTEVVTQVRKDVLGIRYENGALQPISDSRVQRKSADPTYAATMSAELAAQLSIKAKLYEMLGISFGAKAALLIEATAGSDSTVVNTKGTLTVSAVVGAELSVLDLALLSGEVVFELIKETLWDVPASRATGEEIPDGRETVTASSVGNGNRALVVVFDMSGSMSGERLESAKLSLSRIVSEQPAGAELGVWTYPTAGSSCSVGGFAVPVQPITGTADVMSAIDGLSADGDTPTGEALRAAADSLVADGRAGATVILISDGESNCQMPPCEVAQQLRDEGFDLHVEAVGFQTTDAGRDELACVASATGGAYTEVTDVDDLEAVLVELGRVELAVDVSMGPQVALGTPQHATVTIRNESARDATAVEIAVSTTGSGASRVDPSPLISVGNVPAGASVTRQVRLVPVGQSEGTTQVTASVWSDQSSVTSAEATYTSSTVIDTGASELLSAGSGDPVVVSDSTVTSGDALWPDAAQPERPESGISGPVIVSLGAEQTRIEEFLAACLRDGCAMDAAATQVAMVAVQQLDVSDQLVQMWRESSGRAGESLPVMVAAYPDLFGAEGLQSCPAATTESAAVGRALIGMLNGALAASAERAAATGAEVLFVPSTADALIPDATYCAPSAQVVWQNDRLELTDTGRALVSGALTSWALAAERTPVDPSQITAVREESAQRGEIGEIIAAGIRPAFLPSLTFDLSSTRLGGGVAKPGQPVVFEAGDFAPGSWAVFAIGGSRTLGVAIVDEAGAAILEGHVPPGFAVGKTAITVLGVDATGAVRELTRSITIVQEPPAWVAWSVLGAAVLFLAALGLLVGGFVRSRRDQRRTGSAVSR